MSDDIKFSGVNDSLTTDLPTAEYSSAVIEMIKKSDKKISAKVGYSTTPLYNFMEDLQRNGFVEVGWRQCCGTTHITTIIRREWIKIVKALEKKGVCLLVEPVKHKNGYASNNGGFWKSDIFRLPNPQDHPGRSPRRFQVNKQIPMASAPMHPVVWPLSNPEK